MKILSYLYPTNLNSKVISIEIISYISTSILYLLKLESGDNIFYKYPTTVLESKNIYFEILNKFPLWKLDFKCYPVHNTTTHHSYYKVEIMILINTDLINTYKNMSLGFNYLLLKKNKELPCFNKFDENTSYLPNCDLMQPFADFQIKLYDYQKQSLNKMIQIENQDIEYIVNYSSKINFTTHEFNFDPIKCIISDDIRQIKIKTNGGILADEMGLGKTITSLSLIATNKSVYNDMFKSSKLDETSKIYSKATVIVCPSHLTKQWETEAIKSIKNVKILIINTKKDHEKLTFNDFLVNDIIITSHSFLMNFKYYPTLHYGRITPSLYNPLKRATLLNNKLKEIIYSNDIENIKNVGLPIFEFFYFHRLILDEGHEIFGDMLGNSSLSQYMSNWLSSIDSDNNWFVSGSPFVNIIGVQNAFKYIDMTITDTIYEDFNINYKNLKIDNNIIYDFKEILKKEYIVNNILEKICIRHRKSDVKDINILGYDEHIEWIEFTELERNIYNSKINKIDRSGLLKLCCHPLILESSKKIFGNIDVDLQVIESKLIEYHKQTIISYENKLLKLDITNQAYSMIKKKYENIISDSKYLLTILDKLSNVEIKEDEIDSCAICFEGNELSLTKCGHIYCKSCITKWINSKKNCPICKKDLLLTDIFLINKSIEEPTKQDINPIINKYGSKLGKVIMMIKSLITQKSSRIIIFSQWDHMLSLISKSLIENNIGNSIVKGNVWSRNSAINKFKTGKNVSGDDSQVILLSLKNSASGTNLTEASHIIFIEPIDDSYEVCKAIEGQAIARACRIGQQQKIKLYRLLIKNTIEEEVFNYLNNSSN